MPDRGAAVSWRERGTPDQQPPHTAAATAVDDAARDLATDGPGHRDRDGQESGPALSDDQGSRARRPRRSHHADFAEPAAATATTSIRPAADQLVDTGSVPQHGTERTAGAGTYPQPDTCRT